MAPEKKKRPIDDFELPDAVQVNRLEQERAGAADRVATFNANFVPTGSAFKDTGMLSGTSRDVKRTREIDALLDKSSDRAVTMRGQNVQYDLGLGEIDVNKDRNRINEKGIDVTRELGMGELGLNKDIFGATQERYKKYGEPADQLGVARMAAETRAGYEELGYELPEALTEFNSKYIGKTAEPPKVVGEDSIYYSKPDNPKPHPAMAALSDIGKMVTTGPSNVAMPYAGMTLAKQAGEKLGNLLKPSVRNKVRGKVRRVK